MNLQKMFEMQKALDDRIIKEKGLEGQDLLPNLILALQVELAECANEWRGFKHWSNNQKPRTKIEHFCPTCDGTGDENHDINLQYLEEGHATEPYSKCQDCNGSGKLGESNPLLEEYVDCVHFFLSIAIKKGWEDAMNIQEEGFEELKKKGFEGGLTGIFLEMKWWLLNSYMSSTKKTSFSVAWSLFLSIGTIGFGFKWEQIEAAYMEKNAVNHQRQQEGY
ncbi:MULTISPECIES: dUTP diphosphatase [Bacillus]|uniref:dUTP diphosphatase n=1 Tax=Bacillus TaxID=1386 RepID=UPI000B8BD211|nr:MULTISPECIES: dUTP diphosphatase [Bacillus]OXS81431.1 dUTPase [Bacillus sp. LYLB4]UNE51144.1 dUTPase [Bacillus amyloliquefaciens]